MPPPLNSNDQLHPPDISVYHSGHLKSDNHKGFLAGSISQVSLEPRSPSLEPASAFGYWDDALKLFFTSLGLTQTLHGFEADILIMNPEFERANITPAIKTLLENLKKPPSSISSPKSLNDRKLDHVQHNNTNSDPPVQAQAQSSVVKSISQFIAANRAKNVASNHAEFLKQSSLECARTNPKFVERDRQMSYDVAKNEEGPLHKTVTLSSEATTKKRKRDVVDFTTKSQEGEATEERLKNIEEHLAVKYVPSVPRTFHARLAFLEQHITNLEKQYPPWSALHFKQPNRGWPPPPRPTPIIVPPEHRPSAATSSKAAEGTNRGESSSLHRAVMDRLQVQNAISDLSGGSVK